MKEIIITADDYGAHEFIDKGIKEAIENNCVNTVSCILTFDRAEDSIKELASWCKEKNKKVGIGVHISLTAGKPLLGSEVPSLLGANHKFMEINSFDYDKINPFEVFQEVDKQIEKLKKIGESAGFEPDHISSHHGIMNLFPDFLKINLLLAAKYFIPVRNPVQISREKIWGYRLSPMKREGLYRGLKIIQNKGASQVAISAATMSVKGLKRTMKIFNEGAVKYPDHFIDTFYKRGKKRRLKKILKHLPDHQKSEMVTHLGMGNYVDTPQERDKYNGINFDYFEGRKMELDTLVNQYNINNYLEKNKNVASGRYNSKAERSDWSELK